MYTLYGATFLTTVYTYTYSIVLVPLLCIFNRPLVINLCDESGTVEVVANHVIVCKVRSWVWVLFSYIIHHYFIAHIPILLCWVLFYSLYDIV